MNSLWKCAVCLFAVLLLSQTSCCQQSESDEGDSLGTPVLEQNIQADKQKTLDAPETSTQATDVQVGGAHMWQAPYDTHMVGDARDMRYGWIYQVNNNEPHAGSSQTYHGVPQDLWHRNFDDHVKSFSPNLDKEIAALNEVDSNLGYQTIDTMNLAIPMPIETTAQKPMIEPEAMPDRDMSHMSIIEKVQKSTPSMSMTPLHKETSEITPRQTQSNQMGAPTEKLQMQKAQSLLSNEQTLLMPASAPIATVWKNCGHEVVLSQAPEQISYQFYPQRDQALQQQIPMFEQSGPQQHVSQQQTMLTPTQKTTAFDQMKIQGQFFEQQHVMQQQPMFNPSQQTTSLDQMKTQGSNFEQQHVMQQQPMFIPSQQTTTLNQMGTQNLHFAQQQVMQQQPMSAPIQQKMSLEQNDSRTPSFEQQHVMQQHPMMMPTQQGMLTEQSDSKTPLYDQQHVMQQQPMLLPSQQRMLLEQRGTQKFSFGQQQLMQQQQPILAPSQEQMLSEQKGAQGISFEQVKHAAMITPAQQFSQMSAFDQRLVQQQHQQMPIQNQESLTTGQNFYIIDDPKLQQALQMMTRDQQSQKLQQSEMQITGQDQQTMNEQSMIQLPQQQPMKMPGQQTMITNQQPSLQENVGLEERLASQQQFQAFGSNQATQMLKTNLEAGQTTNSQQMRAQQNMQNFEQGQGLIQQQQQQMPGFQQQEHVSLQPGQIFAVQMQPQQNMQSQSNSEATVAGTPVQTVVGPMDQGKFDEMRAALSGAPDVSTLHLLKRLKTGGHGVVFAIPAVYGGYAGGYSGATYAKPVYLSPMYAAHEHSAYEHSDYGPVLLAENSKAAEDSSSTQSMAVEQTTQLQGISTGSDSAREIKADSPKLTSCQTLSTTPSMAEEDTMYAAASEVAPVEVGASHRGRGCKCNSLERDDDDDDDPPVAAVPIEIHPDGSHRISSEFVGAPLWTSQLSKPYLGFWDPRGLLGRLLKPIEELYNQPPPTIGVAYVPVQKTRRPKSTTSRRASSFSSRYSPQNAIVGAPKPSPIARPPTIVRTQPLEVNPSLVASPQLHVTLPQSPTTPTPVRDAPVPVEALSQVAATRKPPTTKAPLVGAVKKQTPRCIQSNRAPAANREVIGDTQQSQKSAAIEGCIRQCLKDV